MLALRQSECQQPGLHIGRRRRPVKREAWLTAPESDGPPAISGDVGESVVADLIQQGIYLVGGGGMLRGLDLRLEEETEIPVHLVDAPLECVVLGAGRCVEIFDQVEDMFMQRPRR